jgi:hypothetical protein
MTSERQRLANQRNAQRSTGPTTDAGKSIVGNNRLIHGLCSTQTVLPFEDKHEYAQLLSQLREAHQPANEHEDNLVRMIAHHFWRVQRHFRVENGAFLFQEKVFRHRNEIANDETGDPDEMLGIAFWNEGELFERLRRYETTIHSSYFKTIQRLEHAQKLRKDREAALPKPEPASPAPVESAPNHAEPEQEPETAAPVTAAISPSIVKAAPPQVSENGNGFESRNQPPAPPADEIPGLETHLDITTAIHLMLENPRF